jgi:L-seryl-tRNA(Ser) seleniumtransferase
MALPPWTIEVLRRGLTDVARKASAPDTLEKIKSQASEILQDLPQTAARGIDAVLRSAEAGKRSVERWTRKHTALAVPMLNASGVLIHDFGTGVPLSEQVVEVGRELLVGDVVGGEIEQARLAKRIQRLMPSQHHSLLITANFPAAMNAFSLLVQRRRLVVHRGHAVELPGGTPLPEAFEMLIPVIQEVGSINRVDPRDFDGLESFCAIVADGGEHPAALMDFTGRQAQQAVVLPIATFQSSPHETIPSVDSMLKSGADFVILPGDGLAGGPTCGLLIGPADEIDWIRASTAWPTLRASNAVQGMMVAALEQAATSPEELPVHALLGTNVENLRARAERLATRLTAVESIRTCQVTADDARLTARGRWRFPSRQLRLQHASMSPEQWAEQLREEVPSIECSIVDGQLQVDLRWIMPADDKKLATALGGETEDSDLAG